MGGGVLMSEVPLYGRPKSSDSTDNSSPLVLFSNDDSLRDIRCRSYATDCGGVGVGGEREGEREGESACEGEREGERGRERNKERGRGRGGDGERERVSMCERERERERTREREREREASEDQRAAGVACENSTCKTVKARLWP